MLPGWQMRTAFAFDGKNRRNGVRRFAVRGATGAILQQFADGGKRRVVVRMLGHLAHIFDVADRVVFVDDEDGTVIEGEFLDQHAVGFAEAVKGG